MDMYNGLLPASGTFTAVNDTSYKERVSYDPNGNILTYWRNGDVARPVMDRLSYFYTANTNRLHKVADAAADAGGGTYSQYNDIKQGQADNNYQYDAIGNLIKDNSEGITNITWTVYGKIASITKSGAVIRYVYDAAGNRIMKQTAADTTVYTRDASGNVLSVYNKAAAGTLQQTENHLYGSSRLGMTTQHTAPDTTVLLATGFGYARKSLFIRGAKLFELSNHLGNVLVTITDRRQQSSAAGVNVDYYQADVAGSNDYYPGGMDMPGRQYSATTGYRYGFNGKEKDTEGPVQYDYGFRIYDPRLVRFKSVDPLTAKYPWLTPYQYASNSPIALIDIDGAEGGVPPKENAVINVFLYPSDMFNGTDKDIAQIPGYLQAKAQQDVGNNIRALQVASKTDAYNQIFQLKSQGYIIGNLVIESHGEHGTSFSIGSDEFKTGTEPELKAITDGMIGHIVLMGCEVGMNKELITNLANSTGQSVYAHQGWTSDWPGMFNDPDVSPQFLRPVVEYLYNNNDEFRTEVRSKAPWILRWAISDETFINRATNSIIEQGVSPSGSADIWANEYHPDFVDPATGQSKRNTYETRVGVWALASPEIGYNIIVPGALKFTPSGGIEWTPKSFYDTYWGQIYKKAVEARYNTTINPSSNEP